MRHGQDSLLDHGALHVVVLDDDVLLQDLDRVQLVSALALGQHHLEDRGNHRSSFTASVTILITVVLLILVNLGLLSSFPFYLASDLFQIRCRYSTFTSISN